MVAKAESSTDNWPKNELQVLLADWSERQREIVVRSQSESSIFVLLITAAGAVAATIIGVTTKSTALAAVFPLLAAVGALVLTSLPINLSHIASSTEVRRLYIQTHLEARIRELASIDRPSDGQADVALLEFEQYDRMQHKGIFNAVILIRALFAYVPSVILLLAYLDSRLPALGGVWPWATAPWLVVAELAACGVAVGVLLVSGSAGGAMYFRIKAEREKHKLPKL